MELFLPGLFERLPEWRATGLTLPALPALETLLGQARPVPAANDTPAAEHDADPFARLCREWLGQPSCAYGPLRLVGGGGQPGGQYCLCLDPVNLQPDMERLLLTDAATFGLSWEEVQPWITALNDHFAAAGWRIVATQPHQWHLLLAQAPAIETPPLPRLAGRGMTHFPLQGEAAPRWQAWLNEIQMLLAMQPRNQAREARGEPMVNGVWPWGGGYLPAACELPWTSVTTDVAMLDGLAQVAGRQAQPWPEAVSDWLAGVPPGRHCLASERLWQAMRHDDVPRWQAELQALDRDYLAPLIAALRQHRLHSLTLDSGDGRRFQLSRSRLRQFWRRRRAVWAWAQPLHTTVNV